jgi:hypothetical protein
MGMREGMLWFDNSEQREIDAKIMRAVEYYQAKYGARPTLCFVHPTMIPGDSAVLEGIELRGTNSVLPNHFWLGTGEEVKVSAA